jgi:hypothetical protein
LVMKMNWINFNEFVCLVDEFNKVMEDGNEMDCDEYYGFDKEGYLKFLVWLKVLEIERILGV